MDEVKKKGYKVVLCSASKKVLLIDQLKEFDIYDRFDDVIGLDDHFAVSKLELAKEYIKNKKVDLANSYFIGDTTHDAEVGVECGLNVLLIERGHQSKEVLNSTKKTVLSSFVDVLKVL
jgi:phosphoglycolate phosphatase